MSPEELMTSLIRRYMSDAVWFVPVQNADRPVPDGLLPGEGVVGWYLPPIEMADPALMFTTHAVVIEWAPPDRIAWTDMTGYEHPSKETPRGVVVETTTGRRFVPIAGAKQGTTNKDAFSFLMLVRMVLP